MNKTSLVMLIVILSIAISISARAELASNSSNSNTVQASSQNDVVTASPDDVQNLAKTQQKEPIKNISNEKKKEETPKESEWDEFAEALGSVTLLSLIATFILGFTMRKNPKVLMPWHKRVAVFTLISGITHGLMYLF